MGLIRKGDGHLSIQAEGVKDASGDTFEFGDIAEGEFVKLEDGRLIGAEVEVEPLNALPSHLEAAGPIPTNSTHTDIVSSETSYTLEGFETGAAFPFKSIRNISSSGTATVELSRYLEGDAGTAEVVIPAGGSLIAFWTEDGLNEEGGTWVIRHLDTAGAGAAPIAGPTGNITVDEESGEVDLAGSIALNAVKASDVLTVGSKGSIATVDVATTEAIMGSFTAAGAGVGKTLTANDVGTFDIDGTTLLTGMFVVVKNEAAGSKGSPGNRIHHGLYEVTDGGGATAVVLTRATVLDEPDDFTRANAAHVSVADGLENAGKKFYIGDNNTGNDVDSGRYLMFSEYAGDAVFEGGQVAFPVGYGIGFDGKEPVDSAEVIAEATDATDVVLRFNELLAFLKLRGDVRSS